MRPARLLLVVLLSAVLVSPATGGSASSSRYTPYAGLGTWLDIYATAAWADPQ